MDLVRRQLLKTIQAHHDKIYDLALSRDGKTIISCSSDSMLSIVQLANARHHSIDSAIDRVLALAISPDGKQVAGGLIDGKIQLWDIATGESISYWQGHDSAVKS